MTSSSHPARGDRLDLGALLAAVENAPPVAAVEVLGGMLAEHLDAYAVSFLIADFSGQALIRLGHVAPGDVTLSADRKTAESVPLADSPYGRALARQSVEVVAEADQTRVYAPVTNRGEAIGVLELALAAAPDEETLADIALAAHALAYVVIANRRFTDLFAWGQRTVPLSLAAEIQHRLLPGTYTCEAGQFTLAAWLEPAGDIGGDTFDFAIERDTLHLSMTDAMGHEVHAAVLATVLVAALRNARRAELGLAEQAHFANVSLNAYAPEIGHVTGQVVRVDLSNETATIVNAGHPLPLRLRAGRVEEIVLEHDPPFGLDAAHEYAVQSLPLEPGDRLIFLTDGMLERNAGDLDIRELVAAAGALHPREAVQHLAQAVLQACGGKLHDDATVMCFDWHGGPQRDRSTGSGANT